MDAASINRKSEVVALRFVSMGVVPVAVLERRWVGELLVKIAQRGLLVLKCCVPDEAVRASVFGAATSTLSRRIWLSVNSSSSALKSPRRVELALDC